MAGPDELQERWRQIYATHLPSLAKAKDPVQKKWPVYLDHCFARIVLDNAIGKDKPWTEILKQPAIRNMNEDQLKDAIELAEKIATGQVDLAELNEQSLLFRGKSKTKKRAAEDDSAERKRSKKSRVIDEPDTEKPLKKEKVNKKAHIGNETVSKYFTPAPKEEGTDDLKTTALEREDHTTELKRIESSSITPFRKTVLSLLCQIPRGRYSTYGALSDHISQTSRKTCARAVGSGIRNNPFAPEVPCHRILAGDGSIGGFCGDWGKDGKFANEKHKLLSEEGVKFDSKGKVKGPPFRDFT